jgi:hypothetical protein
MAQKELRRRGPQRDAGALGKLRGRGRISSNLVQLRPPQAKNGVQWERIPRLPRPSRVSLPAPPYLRGGPRRSNRDPGDSSQTPWQLQRAGPGNPLPPPSDSRLHPLGAPGSSFLFTERSAGAGAGAVGGGTSCPAAAGRPAPGAGRAPGGGDRGRGGAGIGAGPASHTPAACTRGSGQGRCFPLQVLPVGVRCVPAWELEDPTSTPRRIAAPSYAPLLPFVDGQDGVMHTNHKIVRIKGKTSVSDLLSKLNS